MMLVVCTRCSLALRVMDDLDGEATILIGERSDFWPDNYLCSRCLGKASGILEHEAEPRALATMEVVDLTAQELYRALLGLGLPSEQRCTKDAVEALFQQPVRKVSGKEVPNTGRYMLDFIEFWDGTKAYFGAGALGAVVYRIVPPHSYVEQVTHG